MPPILICARLDPRRMILGAVLDHCRRCRERIAVARAGQRELARNDELEPWCLECAAGVLRDSKVVEIRAADGAIEEAQAHLSQRKPQAEA